jgi:glycosyltransferase involved in cell wall biosynthesis
VILIIDHFVGPLKEDISKSIQVVNKSNYKGLKLKGKIIIFSPMRSVSINYLSLIIRFKMNYQATLVCREANLFNREKDELSFVKWLYFISLIRVTYALASLLICNSADTKKDVESLNIIAKRKVFLLPNPVLTEAHGDGLGREVPRSDRLRIVTVGRLHPQKDHDTLLKAFSLIQLQFPAASLTIVGTGEQKGFINAQIATLELRNVTLIPYVSDIVNYLTNFDVFILTSQFEGFGNVLVEALHAGCLIISTDCPGGPREILGKYDGTKLVPVADPAAIAAAVKEIIVAGTTVSARDLNIYTVRSYAKELENLLS